MKCVFAILFSVLFFLPAAKGQGGICGMTHTKLNYLDGVTIEIFKDNASIGKSTSEDYGKYMIKKLVRGTYDIEYSLKGYCKKRIIGLKIYDSKTIKINCEMRLGNSVDTVFYTIPEIEPLRILRMVPLGPNDPMFKHLNKTDTEKDFQYTNLEYFISTLPQLQR